MSEDLPKFRRKIDEIFKTDSLPKFRKILRHGLKPKNLLQQMSRLFIFLFVERKPSFNSWKKDGIIFSVQQKLIEKSYLKTSS